jgi:hypothetical protein
MMNETFLGGDYHYRILYDLIFIQSDDDNDNECVHAFYHSSNGRVCFLGFLLNFFFFFLSLVLKLNFFFFGYLYSV